MVFSLVTFTNATEDPPLAGAAAGGVPEAAASKITVVRGTGADCGPGSSAGMQQTLLR